MAKRVKDKAPKHVEALRHTGDKRVNIPTAEHQSVLSADDAARREVRYPRNTDLDPQLVWRGKDYQDWSDLVVQAPPLYIQEKVHPKALIDDLLRESKGARAQESGAQIDLFGDFNGVPEGADRTDFYQHDQNWTNRMILGDSLQVMASLAEREGLRGKVQCIYIDPPYGIKFNSNFQWSTTSRDVKDGKSEHITRDPEQVKAFRDTWRDGIHTYLSYLRDRLVVSRDLLGQSGSIFVQIGDENVHIVRSVLDEVFGSANFAAQIAFVKTSAVSSPEAKTNVIGDLFDYVLWYAKDLEAVKYRQPLKAKEFGESTEYRRVELTDGSRMSNWDSDLEPPVGTRYYRQDNIISAGASETLSVPFEAFGNAYKPNASSHWKTTLVGMSMLYKASRLEPRGSQLSYVLFFDDFSVTPIGNIWNDVLLSSRAEDKVYVVQTSSKVVQRCLLMCTDPGDLVLDPTCGSGTTAAVAEQLGRRWIAVDTSRVALALARARVMGSRFPYYLLADSAAGIRQDAEVTGRLAQERPSHNNVRQGFVYQRVPHITLRSIANNLEIDVIWQKWQQTLELLRDQLNSIANTSWQEWQIPRQPDLSWSEEAKTLHTRWWDARIMRQKEIDASIASKAEFEYLYDKPYEDKKIVRVAGPFTVESLSPHRTLGVGEHGELIDPLQAKTTGTSAQSFEQMILENLRTAGVQQAHKADRITFESLKPWPGEMVCAEGRYREAGSERRAAVFIGHEFGTVSRPDLVAAAREAGDAGFDVLIACAFNYEAHASEFNKLGRIPVLKARMNADLHMGGELKATGKGNLFVIFGEPDIDILHQDDGMIRVNVKGVDVFDPSTGEVRSDGADGIACWFIDTDYNEESFFVRHAYFLGQNDPYGALKTTLKAEIDPDTWSTLNSDVSRPFPIPNNGRIAVKVINHLGDEVMKVFRVE